MEQDQTWPYVLTKALGPPKSAVHVVATTGWATDELLASIACQEEAGLMRLLRRGDPADWCKQPGRVHGRPHEEYRQQFSELLDLAIRYACPAKKATEEEGALLSVINILHTLQILHLCAEVPVL